MKDAEKLDTMGIQIIKQCFAEIIGLFINNELLQDDGFIDLSKGKVISINGLDGYSIPQLKTRLPYQRPKEVLQL